MHASLIRRSRRAALLARFLKGCALPVMWAAKALTSLVAAIIAAARRQESIAASLWTEAITAGQRETPR